MSTTGGVSLPIQLGQEGLIKQEQQQRKNAICKAVVGGIGGSLLIALGILLLVLVIKASLQVAMPLDKMRVMILVKGYVLGFALTFGGGALGFFCIKPFLSEINKKLTEIKPKE